MRIEINLSEKAIKHFQDSADINKRSRKAQIESTLEIIADYPTKIEFNFEYSSNIKNKLKEVKK